LSVRETAGQGRSMSCQSSSPTEVVGTPALPRLVRAVRPHRLRGFIDPANDAQSARFEVDLRRGVGVTSTDVRIQAGSTIRNLCRGPRPRNDPDVLELRPSCGPAIDSLRTMVRLSLWLRGQPGFECRSQHPRERTSRGTPEHGGTDARGWNASTGPERSASVPEEARKRDPPGLPRMGTVAHFGERLIGDAGCYKPSIPGNIPRLTIRPLDEPLRLPPGGRSRGGPPAPRPQSPPPGFRLPFRRKRPKRTGSPHAPRPGARSSL